MAAGKEARGPLWVEGEFTVRVRGPGPGEGRVVRVRRPFALVGQIPGAGIRLDEPGVDGRHALLVLDRRGLFGVDLLSGSGTRFAGAARGSSWLGAGDIFEIAGRRVELLRARVDGAAIGPARPADDPLAVADPSALAGLTLEPLDSAGPPWMLGSALAFVGRGEACAIRVENASASRIHCALLRAPSAAYVIDLLGRRTLVEGRPVEGASALLDGDVLTVGRARFAVRVEAPARPPRPDGADAGPGGLALAPREAVPAIPRDAAGPGRELTGPEVLEALGRLRADAAALIGAQADRIEALRREVASLRDEVRARGLPADVPPGVGPPHPPPADPGREPAAWLLDRLDALETGGRSTWKDLLGRITSAVHQQAAPAPGPGHTGAGPGNRP